MKQISHNVVNNENLCINNGSFHMERSPQIDEQEEMKSNINNVISNERRSKSIAKKKHKASGQLSELKDGMIRKKSKGKKDLAISKDQNKTEKLVFMQDVFITGKGQLSINQGKKKKKGKAGSISKKCKKINGLDICTVEELNKIRLNKSLSPSRVRE